MNSKVIQLPVLSGSWEIKIPSFKRLQPILIFLGLLLLWALVRRWLYFLDNTAGYVDPSVSVLVILSLVTFLIVCALTWWMMQYFWLSLELPPIKHMVSQFNTLALWQQLGFYWASFVLVLLAALGCLIAIC